MIEKYFLFWIFLFLFSIECNLYSSAVSFKNTLSYPVIIETDSNKLKGILTLAKFLPRVVCFKIDSNCKVKKMFKIKTSRSLSKEELETIWQLSASSASKGKNVNLYQFFLILYRLDFRFLFLFFFKKLFEKVLTLVGWLKILPMPFYRIFLSIAAFQFFKWTL